MEGEGRIGATRAESQWIVAARPLCHLQYPSPRYDLSRPCKGILPADSVEIGNFKAFPPRTRHARGVRQRHVPFGGQKAPTAGRLTGGGRMRRF
ncbi:Regulator of rDNA transcription protein 15 [Quillaja saponaria]|uniref:Regulator of rDNA transcription protein 15 n=1 Tax=Quillaja saponaria TaxID=32244 RepID=A0AAD7KLU8_QUISA|nr:Regulator of rDNA transcription protein 15 [Quillaja saponaria]